jgi:hypothetical protein
VSTIVLSFAVAVQAAFRRISNDVFEHLLELDLSFHVHRKTGQIMRILDRGTSSIQVCQTLPSERPPWRARSHAVHRQQKPCAGGPGTAGALSQGSSLGRPPANASR